jgi:alkanesulfonate monooxygenase SsuD/methylene tetrahydromethanopterin reductase-like flavin-dependent oxidoreductase (luciferase family)
MAANLDELSGGRLVLGVGVGWARQEFEALGVPFQRRGALTDDHLRALRDALGVIGGGEDGDGRIPIWVGGNSDAGVRRAVLLGDAWHPLRRTMPWLRSAAGRLDAVAAELGRPAPSMAPRIALRLTTSPVTEPGRLAGEGTIEQVLDDLDGLRLLGAETVVLDPFNGDPGETLHPEAAWRDLAAVTTGWERRTGDTRGDTRMERL